MLQVTHDELEVIRLQLKRLAYARDDLNVLLEALRLMGYDRLATRMAAPLMNIAQAEGEIEQAVFGARSAS